jgi:uncharacterized short protein YbdD (DUF466 family)
MKKFFAFLSLIKKSLNGDFAYENYLKHAKIHPDEKPLSKKEFLLQRQRDKAKKVNRCC